MLSNIEGIEPLSIFFLILVQFGGRYLKIELTPAQQKIINNSIFQYLILKLHRARSYLDMTGHKKVRTPESFCIANRSV